jgi:hypothetical protein
MLLSRSCSAGSARSAAQAPFRIFRNESQQIVNATPIPKVALVISVARINASQLLQKLYLLGEEGPSSIVKALIGSSEQPGNFSA